MSLSWLPPLIGAAIGGLFALAGGWIQGRSARKAEAARLAHKDDREDRTRRQKRSAEETTNSRAVANLFLNLSDSIRRAWSDQIVLNDEFAGYFENVWPAHRLTLIQAIALLRDDAVRARLMSVVSALGWAKEMGVLEDEERLIRFTVDRWLMVGFDLASAAQREQDPDSTLLSDFAEMAAEHDEIRGAVHERMRRLRARQPGLE